MPDRQIEDDTTRAVANLPGLTIEVVHRRLPDAEAEQISITMQAVPSFAAFGRHLDGINPFVFWVQFAQAAWLPWLGPWASAPPRVAGETPRELDEQKQIAPSEGRDSA